MTPDAAGAPYSDLLLGFGQSNADVHDAGPRLVPRPGEFPDVVAPADGFGIRGLMGRLRRDAIRGFVPANTVEPKIQSLLAAAGSRLLLSRRETQPSRVIVRSEARGGRRFLGFKTDEREVDGILRNHDRALSTIYNNLILTAHDCVDAAKRDGCPVKSLYVVFLHGESDRALTKEVYSDLLNELVDRVEADLQSLDLPVTWLAVQAAGTGFLGDGNAWPDRLSLLEAARERENFHIVCPGYPYQLFDHVHYSGTGKVLLGETVGRLIARREDDGTPPQAPMPAEVTRAGHRITVRFRTDAPLVLDSAAAALDPRPEAETFGFSVTARNQPVLRNVVLDGPDRVVLTCDEEVDLSRADLAYAFARNNRKGSSSIDYPPGIPYGRGYLRTDWSEDSQFVPGATLHDWAVGFHYCLKDVPDDR